MHIMHVRTHIMQEKIDHLCVQAHKHTCISCIKALISRMQSHACMQAHISHIHAITHIVLLLRLISL